MTTRLDEIAHFATLGPEGWSILLFTFYQIPYILPIALPVSCLISSILLIQRLSRTHELTALRASGMGLSTILFPILLAAFFLSLANFYIVSELSTQSHLASNILKSELRSINPLLLLHNKHLLKLKGIFFTTLGSSKMGEMASDVVMAMPNKKNHRINVIFAKNLSSHASEFVGQGITLITALDSEIKGQPDHLVIENLDEMKTSVKDFAQLMEKKVWSPTNDHLRTPLLLFKLSEEKKALTEAKKNSQPVSLQKQIQRSIYRCYSDIARRISIALSVFTFTLMGVAYGITISRNQSHKGIFIVLALGSLSLIAFFLGKGVDHLVWASSSLYLLPHLIILMASLRALSCVSRGVE